MTFNDLTLGSLCSHLQFPTPGFCCHMWRGGQKNEHRRKDIRTWKRKSGSQDPNHHSITYMLHHFRQDA